MAFDIAIRPGVEADFGALCAVKMEAARVWGSDYLSQPLDKAVFDLFLSRQGLWVAVDSEGAACGYAGAYEIEGDFYLHHLFVAQNYAGKGIGGKLVDAVIARAVELQCRAVTLATSGSAPWNAPFYERKGFVILEKGDMPLYLKKFLDKDIAHFDPSLPFVQKTPYVLPRVVMRKPTL